MTRSIVSAMLLALPAPLFAQSALPPEPAVQEALNSHPSVLAASARVDAAKAEARALRAGTHEFIVSGSYIRRAVEREGSYDEYDATVSRAIRLPGKAQLDRKAGQFGISAAENRAEDARHQAAILLNDLWWDWLAASAEAVVDSQSVTNYEAALAAVRRRVQLRDAAPLDADQTEAALGEARAMAAQSRGRADLARARLAARFPALPLPVSVPEPDQPALPAEGLEVMAEQVITRSHEIGAADAEAARMGSLADRARRDRRADPSLGIRVFSERDGAERGAGLVLSMPIGGRARAAAADRAASEAQAASSELALVRLDVREMADGDVARARSAFAAWQRTREALDAQVAALQKLRRGQQLGAIDLSDVLQGERLTHAAFRSEALARTEAHRAINRLRIDSHNLWISE
jgi:outer membrane protein TolC